MTKTGLAAVAIAAAATAAVVTKVGFSYNMSREAAEKAFAGILHDAPKASAFIEELYGWTRKTSLGFDTAVHSAQEFLARGIQLKDVIPYMDTIAEAAAKLPEPMEQSVQRISYAIGQITQSAKLHSQDIRQLTEAGINAWGYLADATGASIDEMQKDAEKFGLTGPRVAEIILAGMRKDSAGMLSIQAQTGRGQIAIASRNFQELSGIFTKPFYDKFVEGLKTVNDIMSNGDVKRAAEIWGQSIADGINIALGPLGLLKKGLESIPNVKISPKVEADASKGIKGSEATGSSYLSAITMPFLYGKKLIDELDRRKDERQRADLEARHSSPQLDELLDKRNFLTRQAASTGGEPARRLQAQIAEVDANIDVYRQALEGSGNAAGNAAGKIFNATTSMETSWQKMVSQAETGLEKTRSALEDITKASGHTTQEGLQAQQNLANYKVDTQPRVDFLQQGIKDLDRESRHAAEATRIASEAKDDEIKAIQRSIDARDRAEERQEIVDRLSKTASEKATLALDDWERSLQRQALTAGPSAADALERQFAAADRGEQRADLQRGVSEARGRKARADAARALQRFDAQTGRQQQLEAVRAAEEQKKNAEALRRLNEEDHIRQLKAKEDKKQGEKDLTKFDRATAEQKTMQKLQDQRDAIAKSGDAIQRGIERQKELKQDELAAIEDQKNKLQTVSDNYDIAVQNAIRLAQLADPDKLPKQADLIRDLNGIVEQFHKFYEDLKEARKIGADIQTARIQREIAEPPAGFNLPEPGGARAMGGRVDPNHWYYVGEHGKEPFIPDTAGYIMPHDGMKGTTTHNTRNITILGPVTVEMGNKGTSKNALDHLYKKM